MGSGYGKPMDDQLMKAITVQQPWATLIILGLKEFETRSWYTNYRGRIAIHSGKKPPTDEQLLRAGLKREDCPLGVVLGTAFLVDCLHMDQDLIDRQSVKEKGFGFWELGRWAFRLVDIHHLPIYEPCKGQLGIWNYGD